MDQIKTLFDAASAIESELGFLEETLSALDLHYVVTERAGYQSPDNFEEWKAISFGREFPSHHATLYLILKDLTEHITALREVDTAIYDAYKAQKEARDDEA